MTHKSIEVIHANLIYKLSFPSKYSAPPASDPPPAAISFRSWDGIDLSTNKKQILSEISS
jgi:hypothetical protein